MTKHFMNSLRAHNIKRTVRVPQIKNGKKIETLQKEWFVVHTNPAVPSNHRMLY